MTDSGSDFPPADLLPYIVRVISLLCSCSGPVWSGLQTHKGQAVEARVGTVQVIVVSLVVDNLPGWR